MTRRYANRELKTKALELLEWALDDMSPESGPKLHLKCGFEREGHFVEPMEDRTITDPTSFTLWQVNNCHMAQAIINKNDHLRESLDRVYPEISGTFILEAVTKPLGLLQATRAIDEMSGVMLDYATQYGCKYYGFGSVCIEGYIDFITKHIGANQDIIKSHFIDYNAEVFDLPGQGRTLVGRGQHCNLSIWLGDRELLRRTGRNAPDFVNLATIKTMEWMPSMFMPCRRGNYHRIAANIEGAAKDFLAGDLSGRKYPYILRYTADKTFRDYVDGTYRFEYRAGAAEADPYDLALAAAAPLVKTCEETMPRDKGKIIIDNSGMVYTEGEYRPFPERSFGKAPTSEAEAAAAFNKPENPYFAYLNELAERKIARMEEKERVNPSPINTENARQARELRGIGNDLFIAYCQEYGLKPCRSAGKSGPGIR